MAAKKSKCKLRRVCADEMVVKRTAFAGLSGTASMANGTLVLKFGPGEADFVAPVVRRAGGGTLDIPPVAVRQVKFVPNPDGEGISLMVWPGGDPTWLTLNETHDSLAAALVRGLAIGSLTYQGQLRLHLEQDRGTVAVWLDQQQGA